MAIATATAIALGTAALTAGATAYGASRSASAQRRAGDQAAAAQGQSSAAQIAFAKDTYNQNASRLDPYNQSGQHAQGVLNGLLYGSSAPNVGGSADGTDWEGYVRANPDAMANWQAIQGTTNDDQFNGSLAAFGEYHYGADGSRRDLAPFQRQAGPGGPGGQANAAFDQFRNSTNYQFRFNEGMKGVQQGMGALGQFDSGASRKAMNDYSANVASDSLGQYMGMLQAQQQTGVSAAGALAGVSMNTMGAVNAATQANGSAAANAALINGRAQGQMYGGIAQGIGSLASSFNNQFGMGAQQQQPGQQQPGAFSSNLSSSLGGIIQPPPPMIWRGP